jgi:hypothetical protein
MMVPDRVPDADPLRSAYLFSRLGPLPVANERLRALESSLDTHRVGTGGDIARRPSQMEHDEFKRNGHVVIRRAFSPRAVALLSEALKRLNPPHSPDGQPPSFMWKQSPEVWAFIFDPRVGGLAADLLDVSGVRLIHDVLFQKRGREKGTTWHRDSDFWRFSGGGALTMWIPLQDTTAEMALRYVTGSHAVPDRRLLRRFEKAALSARYRTARSPLALGDVAIHHYGTLHGSTRYGGSGLRRSLAIHVIDAEARFAAPINVYQERHNRDCSWDQLAPGDPFTDDIAPPMFRR